MTRRKFIESATSAAAVTAATGSFAAPAAAGDRYRATQALIDQVRGADYARYCTLPVEQGEANDRLGRFKFPVLVELEEAFDRVVEAVKTTTVTDKPAVWHVYNMGTVVKTRETCFAIDLRHRRGHELAPLLDFAVITHNHGDHFTEEFYRAMNGAKKMVISNFKDNYAAYFAKKPAGYVRGKKTFAVKDVTVRASLTDHNGYLIDYTTAVEITIGDFVLLHTGDCANVGKVDRASANPDLWIVHPYCGTKTEEAVKTVNPKLTVLAHLNELGHDKWRFGWKDGFSVKKKVEAAGYQAIVPLWGDRIQ